MIFLLVLIPTSPVTAKTQFTELSSDCQDAVLDCKAECLQIVKQGDVVFKKQDLFIVGQREAIAALQSKNRELRSQQSSAIEWYYYVTLGIAIGLAGSVLLHQ